MITAAVSSVTTSFFLVCFASVMPTSGAFGVLSRAVIRLGDVGFRRLDRLHGAAFRRGRRAGQAARPGYEGRASAARDSAGAATKHAQHHGTCCLYEDTSVRVPFL